MEYGDQKAIYLQIAEMICDKIISKEWKPSERIPSVRELATNFEVNPNTVMRTYTYLQNLEVIFNKRGIGYFLSEDAFDKTLEWRKEEFISKELPEFIKTIDALGYTLKDLEQIIKKTRDENK